MTRNARSFRLLRAAWLGAAGALALTAAAPAQDAPDVEALEARISQLEAMLGELRDEVAAARTMAQGAEAMSHQSADAVIRLDRRVQAAETQAAPAAAGGFLAGDTRITYGGFIDLDVHVTDTSDGEIASNSIARDFYIPGAIPVGGSGDDTVDTDFTAQATRFFFDTETPSDLGAMKTHVEMDFLGSPGGDERVSNSFNPRLRTAWLQVGGWRAGQDWSTFQNTAAIPESVSFLIGSDGMIFIRQPLVRYTNGGFQIALENPETTVTPFGGGGRIATDDGAAPDVVARYNFSGGFGNISVGAIGRSLSYQGPGVDSSTVGYGVAVQGRLNLGEGSDLRFSASAGEGLGRYIGLNAVNAVVVDANGELEAIPVYGGLLAWRQSLGGSTRFNLGASYLEADNDAALTGGGVTRSVYSGWANLLTEVAPGVLVGGELLFGERELENGQTGSLTRFTLSTKYAF